MQPSTNDLVGSTKISALSALHAPLSVLQALYEELDSHIADFAGRTGLRCPEGCGACCSSFEPDITDVEGRYVALHLLTLAPELIDRLSAITIQKACVFFEPDSPYHCTIYAARPLICRAFGFAASRGKGGGTVFKGCRIMPRSSAPLDPPVMSDFGLRISSMAVSPRTAMRTEVLRAIASVGLQLHLAGGAVEGSPSPHLNTPPTDAGAA